MGRNGHRDPKAGHPGTSKASAPARRRPALRTCLPWLSICFALCLTPVLPAQVAPEPTPPWDGSLSTPVHRIPLFDELGEPIIPEFRYSLPFSARQTCGPCHPYETISGGLHFNSFRSQPSRDRQPPFDRPGEPWFWVDPKTGTQIPLSYRSWPGTWRPEALGLTPWKFTQLFGRHLPGGDMAEPEDTPADPESRWEVSGKAEINCLGCHSASPLQDQREWAIQMARENFRWAATAASGLGEVGGMASRLPDTWLVYDGLNPDDTEWAVPPFVEYDPTQFDGKHQALFDVVHEPPDNRCLYCHSIHFVDTARWARQQDIHTAAGLACADCHRNGLDHQMIRGYEGQATERGEPSVAEFTCQGCHMPESEGDEPRRGRMGAPYPTHQGLPPIHFEKLSCTACHSGPWPGEEPVRVRTSRANRLGIHGQARWDTVMPQIVEPVFAQGADGKIAPHRLMWPAFWARIEGDRVIPLSPDDVAEKASSVFEAEKQVGSVLAALALDPDATGEPVLVAEGKLFRLNLDGEVDGEIYDGTLSGTVWARDQEGEVVPCVSPFTLDDEGMLDYDSENSILGAMRALASGQLCEFEPVLVHGGRIYRRTWEDLLEGTDLTDGQFESDAFADEPFPVWAWLQEDRLAPLLPPLVIQAVAATDGREQELTESQVAAVLQILVSAVPEQERETTSFAYINAGRLFRLSSAGELIATSHSAANPYLWPLAHEVRPAAQSLGIRACEDCHSPDAPFLFAGIRGVGPLLTGDVASRRMVDFLDLDENYQRLFAYSFFLRPMFKALAVAVSVLIGAVLLLFGLLGLRKVLAFVRQSE